MKDLVLISEQIFHDAVVPADLLDAARFDLRSFQEAKEVLVLAKVMAPKALVLDLEPYAGDALAELGPFVQELTRTNMSQAPIPILGIGSEALLQSPQTFYQAGINELLCRPFETAQMQEKLQTVLGEKFRRFERKEVQYKLNLSHDSQTWSVIARMINQECVVVEGDPLPPMGSNVFVTSAGLDPLSLYLWAHCWRPVKGGLVLRFLHPGQELLEKIERLGAKSIPPAPKEDKKEESDQPPAREVFPFAPLSLEAVISQIKGMCNEKDPPSPWPEILKEVTDTERKLFLDDTKTTPALRNAIGLKVALLGQLLMLQEKDFSRDPREAAPVLEILKSHEETVKQNIQELQKLIQAAMQAQNTDELNRLSALKSQLQRCILAFHKTLQSKGIATPKPTFLQTPVHVPSAGPKPAAKPAPVAKAVPSTQKKPGKGRAILAASLLVAFVVSAFGSYFWYMSKRGRYGSLSQAEVQSLSRYIQAVNQFQKQGKVEFSILLTPQFSQLDEQAQRTELQSLGAKFQAMALHFASIEQNNHREIAVFTQGKLILMMPPKAPEPVKK